MTAVARSARRGLAVTTSGLVHIYRTEDHDVAALSGIDLAVQAGDLVALLGPSGSGKSTLLALCGGLLRPSAGQVVVGEHVLSRLGQGELDALRAADVGLMLQGAARNLLPYFTVRENVRLAQRSARRLGKDVPRVEEVVDLVGLSERADVPLDALTPGFLQLAALAVTVAAGPGLLLADEPTSQLHVSARTRVLETIRRINQEWGTTVVVVTHDPEVSRAMGRTITIRDGRVGGEGRGDREYAVVAEDGSLALPGHVLEDLRPGTLVVLRPDADGHWSIVPATEEELS